MLRDQLIGFAFGKSNGALDAAGASVLKAALLGSSALIAACLLSTEPARAECLPNRFNVDPGDTVTCSGIDIVGYDIGISSLTINVLEGASVTHPTDGTGLDDGLRLQSGTFTVSNRGIITGGDDGIQIDGVNNTINNWGSLIGLDQAGLNISNKKPLPVLGGETIINHETGIIRGPGGLRLNTTGSIENHGLIEGTAADGIGTNGDVTIDNWGTIRGNSALSFGSTTNGSTVTNWETGIIESLGSTGIKVNGDAPNAKIINLGTITASSNGISLRSSDASIDNSGTISGGSRGIEIVDSATGSIINNMVVQVSESEIRIGTISGGNHGIEVQVGTNTIENAGNITGGINGILLGDLAVETTINNAVGGVIEGGTFSIQGGAGVEKVTNKGLLTGNVDLGSGDDSFFHDFTTGSVSGTVDGGDGIDVFGILGSGTFAFPDWALNFEAMEVGVGTEFVIEPAGGTMDLDLSLSVLGTVTQTLGTLNLTDADSVITIKSGGTYDLQSGGISSAPGVAPNLVNSGIFKKTGSSDALIEAFFENKAEGTIDIVAGTATFAGPNILAGAMTINDGARVEFFGSELPTQLDSLTTTGQGVAWFSDVISLTDSTTSTFNLTGDNGKLVIASGTIIEGPGTLESAGNMEFASAAELRTTLNITEGRVTQLGDLTLNGAGAKITVQDTAQYWLRGNSSLLNGPIDNAGFFLNGSLSKAGADMTSTIEIDVTHLGDVVSVDAGAALSITGTQTFAAGETFFTGEGTLVVTDMVFDGGLLKNNITGDGALVLAAGLTITNAKLRNSGNIDWLAGTITGGSVDGIVVTNGLRNEEDGILTVSQPVLLESGLIENFGTLKIDQNLTMNAGLILSEKGATIEIGAQGNISTPDADLSLIENYRGILKKTGGDISQINVGYTSDGGTTGVAAGTLRLTGPTVFKGSDVIPSSILLNSGTTLVLGGPEVKIMGSLKSVGAGTLVIEGDLLALDGTIDFGTPVRWSGSRIEGPEEISFTNSFSIVGNVAKILDTTLFVGNENANLIISNSLETENGEGRIENVFGGLITVDDPGLSLDVNLTLDNDARVLVKKNTGMKFRDVEQLEFLPGVAGAEVRLAGGTWEVEDGAVLELRRFSDSSAPGIGIINSGATVILHGTGRLNNLPFENNIVRFENNGTFELRDGAKMGDDFGNGGVLMNRGTFLVDATSSWETSIGGITGWGAFELTALETQVRRAYWARSGSTTIINGSVTLLLDDDSDGFAGAHFVPGSTLLGSGTLNGTLVMEGNFALGSSPGIFTVNGNYFQTSTGTLFIEIGGTVPGIEYDQLIVNGIATFEPGSTIEITLLDLDGDGTLFEPRTGDVFNFLVSDDIILPAGTMFSDLITFTNLPSGLRFDTGLVTANGMSMLQLFAIFGIDANFLSGLSPQAQGIGGYVNQVLFNAEGTIATEDALADLAGLSDLLIPQAISSLSPQPYGALSLTAVRQASAVSDSLDDHMIRRQGAEGLSLWATGIAGYSSRDGNTSLGTSGSDNNLYGVMAGVDMTLSGGMLLGGFIGTANHDQTFDGLNAESDSDNVFVGGYAGIGTGNLNLGLMAYHGFGNAATERFIPFANESVRSEGDFDHTVVGGKLAYNMGLGKWTATPSVELLYLNVDRGAVTETGSASLAYDVAGGKQDFLLLDTALRLSRSYSTNGGMELVPEITVGYRQELLNDAGSIETRFVGASGAPLVMAGAGYGGDRAIIGGGLTARLKGGIDLFAHYDGELGSGNTNHRVTVGAQVAF